MGTNNKKTRAVRSPGGKRSSLSYSQLTKFILIFSLIVSEVLFFVHGFMLFDSSGAESFEYIGIWNGGSEVVSLIPPVPSLFGLAGAFVMQLCCAAEVLTCLFICRILKIRSRLCAAAVCSLVLFFPAMSAGIFASGLTYSLSLLCASAGVLALESCKKTGIVLSAVLMFLSMAFYAPNVSVILSLYLVSTALDAVSCKDNSRRRIGRDAAVFGIVVSLALAATALKYKFGDYSGILLYSKLSEMSAYDWFHSVVASYTHFLRFCFGHLYLRGSYLLKAVILVWALLCTAVFAFVTIPMLKKKKSRKKAVCAIVCVTVLPLVMSFADFISNDGDRAFHNAFAYVMPFVAGAVLWERLEIRLHSAKKKRSLANARIAGAVCAASFIVACAVASCIYWSSASDLCSYATRLKNEGNDGDSAIRIASNSPVYYDNDGLPFAFPVEYRTASIADSARSYVKDISFHNNTDN